jgi:hypothetical protein
LRGASLWPSQAAPATGKKFAAHPFVAAILAATFFALFAFHSDEARAASTGCDAVNAGSWDITASNILSPATQTGSFKAAEQLAFTITAQLLGAGTAQFSGAFPANTTPVAAGVSQNVNFAVASTGTGQLSLTELGLASISITSASCIPNPPAVTSLSPTSGPASGGTSVTITGTDFTGASAVKFGGTAAASFAVNSDTQITATSPAGSGTVDVTVTTIGGTSATSASDEFTFVPAPTVTAIPRRAVRRPAAQA